MLIHVGVSTYVVHVWFVAFIGSGAPGGTNKPLSCLYIQSIFAHQVLWDRSVALSEM